MEVHAKKLKEFKKNCAKTGAGKSPSSPSGKNIHKSAQRSACVNLLL